MLRAILLVAFGFVGTQAHAQLVVEEAETTENRVTFNLENSLFAGEIPAGAARVVNEASVDWGIISGWKTGLGLELQYTRGADYELRAVEWANTFALFGKESIIGATRDGGWGDLDVSLYLAAEAPVNGNGDLNVEVGPVVDFAFGGIEFGANLLFDVPIGGNGETALLYGSSAMLRVTPMVSVGLEAHSEIARVFGNTPDFDDQIHYVGPAVEAGFMTGTNQRLNVRLGGFFGVTQATPDFAASLNLSLDIN